MGTGRRSLAATAVLLGGLAVMAGSFASWATCRDSSCGGGGGLLAVFRESGFYWGGTDEGVYIITIGGFVAAIASPSLREGWPSIS